MEIEYEAKCYMTIRKCDSCKVGEMISTGCTATQNWKNEIFFEHLCNACNSRALYEKVYPKINYKKIDKE